MPPREVILKLVDDWRRAKRWFSVRAMSVAGVIQLTYLSLPPALQEKMPANWVMAITAILMILGIAGRLLDQAAKSAHEQ